MSDGRQNSVGMQTRSDTGKTRKMRDGFRHSTFQLVFAGDSPLQLFSTRTARKDVAGAEEKYVKARRRAQQYYRAKQQKRKRERDRRAHGQEGII